MDKDDLGTALIISAILVICIAIGAGTFTALSGSSIGLVITVTCAYILLSFAAGIMTEDKTHISKRFRYRIKKYSNGKVDSYQVFRRYWWVCFYLPIGSRYKTFKSANEFVCENEIEESWIKGNKEKVVESL